MKKFLLIASILFISNCASSFTIGGIENTGAMVTGKTFKYISKVQGEAKISRLFLYRIGSGDIYARAMLDITNKTNLYVGSKKGLINVTYDYTVDTILGIYWIETVTITADVVEYLD